MSKIRNVDMVDCIHFYKCPSKRAIENIALHVDYERRNLRQSLLQDLPALELSAFHDFTELSDFKSQYDAPAMRYKFLTVIGCSGLGKTQLIRHHFPRIFAHLGSIDWNGYDPMAHDCILFEDIPTWWDYVILNKPLFQGNCINYKVHTSRCNQYTLSIDVYAKYMIFTSNEHLPYTNSAHKSWIQDNSISLEISDPTF